MIPNSTELARKLGLVVAGVPLVLAKLFSGLVFSVPSIAQCLANEFSRNNRIPNKEKSRWSLFLQTP